MSIVNRGRGGIIELAPRQREVKSGVKKGMKSATAGNVHGDLGCKFLFISFLIRSTAILGGETKNPKEEHFRHVSNSR